jgi:hypothetical protein
MWFTGRTRCNRASANDYAAFDAFFFLVVP